MADANNRYEDNVPGAYYVDRACISCDACCLTAPNNFKMHIDGGHAYVEKQPETPEEQELCVEAMQGCPVECIGDNG